MSSIKVETKTNGYKALGIQPMIEKFEKVASIFFPGCLVRHFYYGDHLDMADIVLNDSDDPDYAYFNITANRVSLNSHSCKPENMRKFESMTYQDELYNGKLIELAAQ